MHSYLRVDTRELNPRKVHSVAPQMADSWKAKAKWNKNRKPTLTEWEKDGDGTVDSVLEAN